MEVSLVVELDSDERELLVSDLLLTLKKLTILGVLLEESVLKVLDSELVELAKIVELDELLNVLRLVFSKYVELESVDEVLNRS